MNPLLTEQERKDMLESAEERKKAYAQEVDRDMQTFFNTTEPERSAPPTPPQQPKTPTSSR